MIVIANIRDQDIAGVETVPVSSRGNSNLIRVGIDGHFSAIGIDNIGGTANLGDFMQPIDCHSGIIVIVLIIAIRHWCCMRG